MASVFLSPSVQEYNPYITGGNEEQYMNLIADEMIPYLEASGIHVTRNNPDEPVAAAIEASNAGSYASTYSYAGAGTCPWFALCGWGSIFYVCFFRCPDP